MMPSRPLNRDWQVPVSPLPKGGSMQLAADCFVNGAEWKRSGQRKSEPPRKDSAGPERPLITPPTTPK